MSKTVKTVETNDDLIELAEGLTSAQQVKMSKFVVGQDSRVKNKKDKVERDYKITEDNIGLYERFETKSAIIRHLHSEGMTCGQIADKLRIRYQHVNNVLRTQTKRK